MVYIPLLGVEAQTGLLIGIRSLSLPMVALALRSALAKNLNSSIATTLHLFNCVHCNKGSS